MKWYMNRSKTHAFHLAAITMHRTLLSLVAAPMYDTLAARNTSSVDFHSTRCLFAAWHRNRRCRKTGKVSSCEHRHFVCLHLHAAWSLREMKWILFRRNPDLYRLEEKAAVLHYRVASQTDLFGLSLVWDGIFGLRANSYLRCYHFKKIMHIRCQTKVSSWELNLISLEVTH